MRDVYQLLREKEAEIARIRQEIEALRSSIPLLLDDQDIDRAEVPGYAPLQAVNQEWSS
jgi:hypothetical protein